MMTALRTAQLETKTSFPIVFCSRIGTKLTSKCLSHPHPCPIPGLIYMPHMTYNNLLYKQKNKGKIVCTAVTPLINSVSIQVLEFL